MLIICGHIALCSKLRTIRVYPPACQDILNARQSWFEMELTRVKRNANEGLSKVYWTLIVTMAVLTVLGGVLWWFDGYILHK